MVAIDDLRTWAEPHVTPKQLAKYWRVSYQGVMRWIWAGRLKATRLERQWRVRTDDARLFQMRLSVPRR